MKKLYYLLLLILLISSYSCSKHDNPSNVDRHKFKVTLNMSGDYKKYKLYTIMQSTSETKKFSRNIQTGEEAYLLETDLIDNFYEFESVEKTISMQFKLVSSTNIDDEINEATIKLNIYLNNQLFYQENISLNKDDKGIDWLYYKNEIHRTPKI